MRQIYFDNGASSYPKPRNVYDKTFEFITLNGANVGRSAHRLAMEAAEAVYKSRIELSNFFGLEDAENVVFTMNATYAINMVLQGVLGQGDHVITTVMEHNSVLRPLYELQRRGVEISIVDVDLYDDETTLTNIEAEVKDNTKAIVISQCSNVCGKMLPIEKIGRRKGKVRLIVDGSQGAGSIPTDIRKSRIDYYCAPFHKGMLGLQGGGFILCGHNELNPIIFGGTGSESARKTQPDRLPERLEAGTLPVPAIYSVREGIRFIKTVGIENIFKHKRSLTEHLYHELNERRKINICADYARMSSAGVLAFNVDDKNSEEVAHFLAEQGIAVRSGLHCAPLFHKKMGTEEQGMVRISMGYANSTREIADFLKILDIFLKKS